MNLKNMLVTAGLATLMGLAGNSVMAQDNNPGPGPGGGGGGGGRPRNFDPAEMQQRMMENIRNEMSVTNNDEWKVIETRVQKVMDARREVGVPGMGRMFGRRGGPPGGGGDNNADRPRRGGFGAPSPEMEALQKAIDSNAPAEQVKAAMQKYRESRKAKEATLEKAQAELQKVLTVKQEAVAVSFGLVN
jgi:hypothetical protein